MRNVRQKEYASAFPINWSVRGDVTPNPKARPNLNLAAALSESQTEAGSATPTPTQTPRTAILRGPRSPFKEYSQSFPDGWTIASIAASPQTGSSPQNAQPRAGCPPDEIRRKQRSPARDKDEEGRKVVGASTEIVLSQPQSVEDVVAIASAQQQVTYHERHYARSTAQKQVQYQVEPRMMLDAGGQPVLGEMSGHVTVGWGDQTMTSPALVYGPSIYPNTTPTLQDTSPSNTSTTDPSPPFPPPPAGYNSTTSPDLYYHYNVSTNAAQYYQPTSTSSTGPTISPQVAGSAGPFAYSAYSYSHVAQPSDTTTPWSALQSNNSDTDSPNSVAAGSVGFVPSPYSLGWTGRASVGTYVPLPAGYAHTSPQETRPSVTQPGNSSYRVTNPSVAYHWDSSSGTSGQQTSQIPMQMYAPWPPDVLITQGDTGQRDMNLPPPAPVERKRAEWPQWVGLNEE